MDERGVPSVACRGGVILQDSGYLVQWEGINSETGEAWKPVWVSRDACSPEMIALWESNKPVKPDPMLKVHTLKRLDPAFETTESESVVEGEAIVCAAVSQKRPKIDSNKARARGRPTYSGFRSFNQKPKTARGQLQVPKGVPVQQPPLLDSPFVESGIPDKGSDIDTQWLLDPVISLRQGMLVVIRGSVGAGQTPSWHNGDYEGERGVVLSVLNTGNSAFTSTAQVKLLETREHGPSDFSVPVTYLSPVAPDAPEQKALILDGEYKGEVALVREEGTMENDWFISVKNNHFELGTEKLVRYMDVGTLDV